MAVDPVDERLYLTQDHPAGLLYRYTPTTYPDLSDGLLEAATVAGNAVTWTEVPTAMGTPGFMAPEQAQGKTIDRRSDIFSLGILLYEMLSGRRMYEGDTLRTNLAMLRRLLKVMPIDTITPRRRLAHELLQW